MRISSLFKRHKSESWRFFAYSTLNAAGILLFAAALSTLIDSFVEKQEFNGAASYLLALLFAMLLKTMANYLLESSAVKFSSKIAVMLREKLHEAFMEDKKNVKNPDSILIEGVEAVREGIETTVPIIAGLIIHSPVIFLCVLFFDAKTAVIMLVTLPVAPILLYLIGSVTKAKNEKRWKELFNLQEKFTEILKCVITIKIFRGEEGQRERLKKISSEFSSASLDVLKTAFVSSFAIELATTLSIAIIAVTLGFRLLESTVSFQTAFFILLTLPFFYQPIRQSGLAFHSFMNAKTAWAEIKPYFDNPTTEEITRKNEKIKHPPTLTVKNLTVHPILKNISFKLPANSVTLLLGESGSGKTTLLNAIANMIDENITGEITGEILIEEYPVNKIAPENISRHVAYAPQSPHIFNASLRDNIALFTDYSEERIIEALKMSVLYDWFKNLPGKNAEEKLQTNLGENGIRLSAGERRRLGLARAIFLNSPLLLLDEVTAGLDEVTEEKILDNLSIIAFGKTVLFATHREKAIERFKRKIVLDGGMLCGK